VEALDFLSSEENHIDKNVKLIDFDQCFRASSPPKEMLGTPAEFLAPEVVVGLNAGPASDVWALGCSIFRIRSGESPFSGYEVTSPADQGCQQLVPVTVQKQIQQKLTVIAFDPNCTTTKRGVFC
jgi:serine/threonine protein kinase